MNRIRLPRRHLVLALLAGILASAGARAADFDSYSGRQLYERFCAACHGGGGFGDGPVAGSLKVAVPDLTRISRRSGGSFPTERVRRVIEGSVGLPAHGTRLMPVWGYEFAVEGTMNSATAIDKLVEYLQGIQQ